MAAVVGVAGDGVLGAVQGGAAVRRGRAVGGAVLEMRASHRSGRGRDRPVLAASQR